MYRILAKRSAMSVCGEATAWAKVGGKVFETKDKAEATRVCKDMNDRTRSMNVHYVVKARVKIKIGGKGMGNWIVRLMADGVQVEAWYYVGDADEAADNALNDIERGWKDHVDEIIVEAE